jgi:hypothetical protein
MVRTSGRPRNAPIDRKSVQSTCCQERRDDGKDYQLVAPMAEATPSMIRTARAIGRLPGQRATIYGNVAEPVRLRGPYARVLLPLIQHERKNLHHVE